MVCSSLVFKVTEHVVAPCVTSIHALDTNAVVSVICMCL